MTLIVATLTALLCNLILTAALTIPVQFGKVARHKKTAYAAAAIFAAVPTVGIAIGSPNGETTAGILIGWGAFAGILLLHLRHNGNDAPKRSEDGNHLRRGANKNAKAKTTP